MSSPGLECLAKWLDEHLHDENGRKVILIDSTDGDIYKFEAAFLFFVLEGEINLSTNQMANGSLYLAAPLWGRVNLVEGIAGNLNNLISSQFSHGPDLNGGFSLSLDNKKLFIDYDFSIKFVGFLADKLSLLTLPSSSASVAPAQPITTSKFSMDPDTYKLFDKFIDDHFDPNTHNFVVKSGDVGISPSGEKLIAGASNGSKEFTFIVAFLEVFMLTGGIDPDTLALDSNLYILVPFWGPLLVVPISGNLKDAIVTFIQKPGVTGSFGLRLIGKDLMATVDLDVKFARKYQETVKLFTLPF